MFAYSTIGKLIIVVGLVAIVVGLFFMIGLKHVPLTRMPGDISIKKGNFFLYVPIGIPIGISILLTLILNLFFRR